MERELSGRIRAFGSWLLDFALPPRCAGCGAIVGEVHSFCADCWRQIEFLGAGGCRTCGLPLQATEAEDCAICLAIPPRIRRTIGHLPEQLIKVLVHAGDDEQCRCQGGSLRSVKPSCAQFAGLRSFEQLR